MSWNETQYNILKYPFLLCLGIGKIYQGRIESVEESLDVLNLEAGRHLL